ncbi:TrbC/VirB2 family protein [Sphingomonas sp. So64.6b]|nr:TrbC/VirB2 family protein [Sphingomonas sp. So64.6b]
MIDRRAAKRSGTTSGTPIAMASFAVFSYSLADPIGSDPLVAAMAWLQGSLLGTVATTIAVVAVAVIGLMMLSGRINWRYGATVITGCFILFGAGTIAAGIRSASGGGGSYEPVVAAPYVAAPVPPPPVIRAPPPTAYDPYAGAAPRNM